MLGLRESTSKASTYKGREGKIWEDGVKMIYGHRRQKPSSRHCINSKTLVIAYTSLLESHSVTLSSNYVNFCIML